MVAYGPFGVFRVWVIENETEEQEFESTRQLQLIHGLA